jgi:hypothetical protein
MMSGRARQKNHTEGCPVLQTGTGRESHCGAIHKFNDDVNVNFNANFNVKNARLKAAATNSKTTAKLKGPAG